MHGLVNLNKPAGVTSRDAVNQLQRLVRPAKIGHAGTLDPLATGVLVICIGDATRLIEYVQRQPKTYDATFLLGRYSDTEDVEGNVVPLEAPLRPSLDELQNALPRFLGRIPQHPPSYSAIKVQGQRAYDLARRGQVVELEAREVEIHSLKILEYDYPRLRLLIECGSGTYVRSLGRDLAESLGTAAVMSELTRTAIGCFRLADAVQLDGLDLPSLSQVLLPPVAAVRALPQVELTESEEAAVLNGQFVRRPRHGFSYEVAGVSSHGDLVAVLRPADENHLRPEKVLCSARR